jgi:hypothetical protein
MAVFRNERKIDAILESAEHIRITGFARFKQAVARDPITTLQRLPMLGPITSHHLAKSLGLQAAKSDRHLQRIADALGFSGVAEMCRKLCEHSGDPISVVDIVLWRFAEQHFGLRGKMAIEAEAFLSVILARLPSDENQTVVTLRQSPPYKMHTVGTV